MSDRKDTVPTKYIRYGHKTVGATAVKLTSISTEMKKGILVRAPGADDPTPNTVPVWIGTNDSVTADSDAETGGMPLVPGASLTIPTDGADELWVISTAASQDVAWIGV